MKPIQIPRKQETKTVEKEITICVGDETGSDRYVKVDDSKEVYTITEDSLTGAAVVLAR